MTTVQELRKLAHQCISDQEALERNYGEYDVKASLWALSALRGSIDREPWEGDAEHYLAYLLGRMRQCQQEYRSDTFSEEYNGARASMGSAINTFERRAQELLGIGDADTPPTESPDAAASDGPVVVAKKRSYRWIWWSWFAIMFVYFLLHL